MEAPRSSIRLAANKQTSTANPSGSATSGSGPTYTYTITPPTGDDDPIILRCLDNPKYICFANTALQTLVWLSVDGPLSFIIEQWATISSHVWLNTDVDVNVQAVMPKGKRKTLTSNEDVPPTPMTPLTHLTPPTTLTPTPIKRLFQQLFIDRQLNQSEFDPSPALVMLGLHSLRMLTNSNIDCKLSGDIKIASTVKDQQIEDAYLVFDWLYRCFIHMAGKLIYRCVLY